MAVIGMVVGCLMMVAGAAWAVDMPGAANGTLNAGNLVWLLNPNSCLGKMNWDSAVSRAESLASGQCGLTDGSKAGQWRLPTEDELNGIRHAATLLKLGDFGYWSSDSGYNFVRVKYTKYKITDDSQAVLCYMRFGGENESQLKFNSGYVLPVRGVVRVH